MPLLKVITINSSTKVFLWKITEDFNELSRNVSLTDVSLARLKGMKSESHQKGFLAVRMLLQHCGYTDFDLYYDVFGKPHLKDSLGQTQDEAHISISHSFDFSAIILSDENIGIDLELRRDKIMRLAEKFAEESFVYEVRENHSDFISKLTVIWGVKEAIFKIRNELAISFKDHIFVQPFEISDEKCTAKLHFNGVIQNYNITFEEIESYTVVCAIEAV